jgi:mannose-binding lectin 2
LEWLVPAVQFNVNGQGTTLYGDGFAFWYTQGIQQIGSVFGSADGFKGIGVFFDT